MANGSLVGGGSRRIQTFNPNVTTSGGGAPITPTVSMGPSFGNEPNAASGISHKVQNTLTLPNVGIVTPLGAKGTLTMPSLNLDNTNSPLNPRPTLTIPTVAMNNNNQTVQGTVTMPTLVTDFSSSPNQSRGALDNVKFTTSTLLASKDSWVDAAAACASGDTNHNGTDLQVNSTPATAKEIDMGWDLSAFATSDMICTAATLTLNRKTTSALAQSLDIFTLDDVPSTWAETTVKCSNRPSAAGTLVGTMSLGTTSGDKTATLDAKALAMINKAFGSSTGTFSLIARMNTAASTDTFESKDEGTGDANGPRLTLTFESNNKPIQVSDDFNSYANGNLSGLNGGTGWAGAWSSLGTDDGFFNIESTNFAEGKAVNALTTLTASNTRNIFTRSFVSDLKNTDVDIDFYVQVADNNQSNNGGNPDTYIGIDRAGIYIKNNGQFALLNGTITDFFAYSINVWYRVRLRFRRSGGETWVSARVNNNAYTIPAVYTGQITWIVLIIHAAVSTTTSYFLDKLEIRY